mmetsp:Transcript_1346/g.5479  ORF Transcript_1346/g.5479 Transcript_1346/m.5479 type:complete len:252 (-) Transcript_1346:339-1094(-)
MLGLVARLRVDAKLGHETLRELGAPIVHAGAAAEASRSRGLDPQSRHHAPTNLGADRVAVFVADGSRERPRNVHVLLGELHVGGGHEVLRGHAARGLGLLPPAELDPAVFGDPQARRAVDEHDGSRCPGGVEKVRRARGVHEGRIRLQHLRFGQRRDGRSDDPRARDAPPRGILGEFLCLGERLHRGRGDGRRPARGDDEAEGHRISLGTLARVRFRRRGGAAGSSGDGAVEGGSMLTRLPRLRFRGDSAA